MSSSSTPCRCRCSACWATRSAPSSRALHADHGVELRMGTGVAEMRGGTSVDQVVLSDGAVEPADLVVVGIGVAPRVELAVAAGLDVDNGSRRRRSAAGERTGRLRRRRRGVGLAPPFPAATSASSTGPTRSTRGSPRAPTRPAARRPTTDCRTSSPTSTTSAWSTSATPNRDDPVVIRGSTADREFIAFWQRRRRRDGGDERQRVGRRRGPQGDHHRRHGDRSAAASPTPTCPARRIFQVNLRPHSFARFARSLRSVELVERLRRTHLWAAGQQVALAPPASGLPPPSAEDQCHHPCRGRSSDGMWLVGLYRPRHVPHDDQRQAATTSGSATSAATSTRLSTTPSSMTATRRWSRSPQPTHPFDSDGLRQLDPGLTGRGVRHRYGDVGHGAIRLQRSVPIRAQASRKESTQ